jgi:RNA recognition motif-containing protein
MNTERDTGQSKGFGFVEMISNSGTQKAIQELDDCLRSMKPTRRRREVMVATAPEFTLSLYCEL